MVNRLLEALKVAKKLAFGKPPRALGPASMALLGYLTRYDAVTPLKAREELGIEHLPRRIKDLKEHGHKIRTVYETSHAGKRYARYSLEKSERLYVAAPPPYTFEATDPVFDGRGTPMAMVRQ